MEQKKQIKISLKTAVILTLIIIILIVGILLLQIANIQKNKKEEIKLTYGISHYYTENYNNTEYYIIEDDYSGEYTIQYLNLHKYTTEEISSFQKSEIMNYKEYKKYCNKWNLKKEYTNEDYNYIVFSYVSGGAPNLKARLAGVEYEENDVILYIWDKASGFTADNLSYVIIIPTEKNIKNIKIQNVYELEEYYNIIGKSPIEDANYGYEDNKILAENAYINTNNMQINEIFNKMLDSIVKNRTMEIKENDEVIEIIDFISSASMWKSNDKKGYTAFGENYSKRYTPTRGGESYIFDYGVARKQIIYNIALYYEWYAILGLSDKEKNPYYNEKHPLIDTLNYICSIDEDENTYIISFYYPEKGEEKYYINKNTYLLEKTTYNHSKREKEYTYNYTETVVNIPDNVFKNSHQITTVDKPIIYLYPTEDTIVTVNLKYKDKITVSYPKYENEWKVIAKTNGNLIDLKTNRNLYSLYYESENIVDFNIEKDGFIVKGEEVATFLEEKLAILGLTEREAQEFIIYWLPKLESNKYNYIRFATSDEINENMPININPNPDTIIRVLMTYKGLENMIEVQEQKLTTPERTGFVAVEWGGTEIK